MILVFEDDLEDGAGPSNYRRFRRFAGVSVTLVAVPTVATLDL